MTMKPLGLSLSGDFGPSLERIRSDLLRRRRELYGLPDVVGALASHADALCMVELGIVPRSVFDEYFWPAFHTVHADAIVLLDVQALNGTSARPPWASSQPKTIRRTVTTMPNIPFADEIHAFLDDEENVEALTDAVQELHRFLRDGTADRPPRGILPIEALQTMTQEDHSQIAGHFNPTPFCYSRPDILDAHIYAMRAACRIGVDLSEDRDFTPTED